MATMASRPGIADCIELGAGLHAPLPVQASAPAARALLIAAQLRPAVERGSESTCERVARADRVDDFDARGLCTPCSSA